jgi:hypothetical protein
VAYFGNFNKLGDLVKAVFNGVSWVGSNFATYLPSQVSCGSGCGSTVICDSPSTGHPKICAVSTDCSAGGTASTCIAGSCRCTAPTTCDATGACACAAPAVCGGGGTCVCPGAGETCSAGVCTCSADSNCAAGQTCVNGRCAQRVNAIAFGQYRDSSNTVQRRLIVGHGATLSITNLANGAQSDINLATCYVPAGGTNQAIVNGILGIAVHPEYGDILVEVKGTNNFRYLLNVDAADNSCRHELSVQRSLQHTQTPTNAVPLDFGSTGDGHIVFMPDGMLLRYEVVVNASPANWTVYNVSK